MNATATPEATEKAAGVAPDFEALLGYTAVPGLLADRVIAMPKASRICA